MNVYMLSAPLLLYSERRSACHRQVWLLQCMRWLHLQKALHHFIHQHPHPHLQHQTSSIDGHLTQFSELSKVVGSTSGNFIIGFSILTRSQQSSGWSCLTKSFSCALFSSRSANGSSVGSVTVACIPQCLKQFTTVSSLTASQACSTHRMAAKMWTDFVISEALSEESSICARACWEEAFDIEL